MTGHLLFQLFHHSFQLVPCKFELQNLLNLGDSCSVFLHVCPEEKVDGSLIQGAEDATSEPQQLQRRVFSFPNVRFSFDSISAEISTSHHDPGSFPHELPGTRCMSHRKVGMARPSVLQSAVQCHRHSSLLQNVRRKACTSFPRCDADVEEHTAAHVSIKNNLVLQK